MGFFGKLSNIASKAASMQANRYENAARNGCVGDRKLTDSLRQIARDKAAELRDLSDRCRR